ncbi:hypothetical protein ACPPVO_07970 [Dactylosporangium sp. McL0621]|uniref:hypothetical protein n=1 Tax=Dactylosporangium sp. McL0621 TaxID=3415678 RepID=UPI003CE772FF
MTRSDRSPHGGQPPSGVARIAVDLLGGDGAPAVVVDGALRACSADPDLHLLLVGPQEVADEVIGALPVTDRERVSVIVVDAAIGMAESPLRNIRRSTSVRAAAEAVYTGRADAMVSAGSSGAAVAASAHVLGRLRGVRRPGLAAQLPTEHGPVLLLDVGVTLDATMLELVQHAVLGTAYASVALGIARPRVGLLSIGSEPGKGDRLRRAVSIALSDIPLPAGGRYVGLVEGFDVPRGGPADVIVTDGFTGNVLLKGIEGAMAAARVAFAAPEPAPYAPAQRSDAPAPDSTDASAFDPRRDRDAFARRGGGADMGHDASAPTSTSGGGGAAPEAARGSGKAALEGRSGGGGAVPDARPGGGRAAPVGTFAAGAVAPEDVRGGGGAAPAGTRGGAEAAPEDARGGAAPEGTRGGAEAAPEDARGGAAPEGTRGSAEAAPEGTRGSAEAAPEDARGGGGAGPEGTSGGGGAAPRGAVARHEAAAVLLGVAGDVVVCHGSAGGAEIADGIALAARLHRYRITPAVAGLADDLLTELSSAGGLTIRDALGERS